MLDRERGAVRFIISCSRTALPTIIHTNLLLIYNQEKKEKIRVGGEESVRRRLGMKWILYVFFCRRTHRELFGGGSISSVPPLSYIDPLFRGVEYMKGYSGTFCSWQCFGREKRVGGQCCLFNAICFMLIGGHIYLWTLRRPV